jgi:hypothetical protein
LELSDESALKVRTQLLDKSVLVAGAGQESAVEREWIERTEEAQTMNEFTDERVHRDLWCPWAGPNNKVRRINMSSEKYGNWFDPAITVRDGKLSVPPAPGVGIKDMQELLKEAVEV